MWLAGLEELRRRGGGQRESGAFLLGRDYGGRRRVEQFVYYDDLAPGSLDRGFISMDGSAYGMLWSLCEETRLAVVADIHTHPGAALQSPIDRRNPMVAKAGHIALIVPDFAQRAVGIAEIGIYVYRGSHEWDAFLGRSAARALYIERWS